MARSTAYADASGDGADGFCFMAEMATYMDRKGFCDGAQTTQAQRPRRSRT